MTYPKMIVFDYGHTLLYEPGWDSVRGEKALFEYVKSNKYKITPEQVNDYSQKLFEEIKIVRKNGFEIHEMQFQRFLYEYLGIELSISLSEAENVFWNAATPGAVMPDADKLLDYLNDIGMRTAVISNIGWSGGALRQRLDRLLPNNRFEFVIASSDYMFRKPNRLLFELALRKAELNACDVWYCGDNPQADAEGSAQVGIFPVWYDNDIEKDYKDRSGETAPNCEHLYIKEWNKIIDVLEELS